MRTALRMGEFEHAQTGIFEFAAGDFRSTSSYFGLDLHEAFLIAHVRNHALGRHLHVVRPIMLRTSGGVSFSVSRPDGVYQDPRCVEFLRGGNFDREADRNGSLVFSGSSGFWAGATSETVSASFGESLAWSDSGRMTLAGRLLGPGTQAYIPSRDGDAAGGLCHTALFYEGQGQLFDEAVSGIVILEQAFSPRGQIVSDSAVRRRFVGGWNGFASVFEDGSTQYGHLTYGTGPFRYANIVDGDRHISCPVESVKAETTREGLGSRLEYHLANGETWEFVAEANGAMKDMIALAKRLGSKAQVHKGHVGRVGERRRRRNWYSIQEWFPDRLAAGARDVSETPIKGF